ncbi:MAG: hypothetical protein AAFV19_21055 [Pseudomonadota bacterium]
MLSLGDTEGVRTRLAHLDAQPETIDRLNVDLLIEEGHIRDAERVAAKLASAYPEDARVLLFRSASLLRGMVVGTPAPPLEPMSATAAVELRDFTRDKLHGQDVVNDFLHG